MTGKKLILAGLIALTAGSAFAKKVQFAVNMKNEIKSPLGIHVCGNFQVAAGFPTDWDPGTTLMTQSPSDTNIYTVVVDIPAFAEYEFKYVNGTMGYETEFVPIESRVNTTSNDNRWIYVDSLASDTQKLGAVIFAGNAPQGQYLLRLSVDMNNDVVSGQGVHVVGDFQNFVANRTQLWSFANNIYEYIAYEDTGMNSTQHEYRFLNGNQTLNYEVLSDWCPQLNNNRWVYVPKDTVLAAPCYASCASCASAGVNEMNAGPDFAVYPNPMNESALVVLYGEAGERSIRITDVQGREVKKYDSFRSSDLRLDKDQLEPGVYFITVSSGSRLSTLKLVVN